MIDARARSQPWRAITRSGTGKSRLIALGAEAAVAGYRVRNTLAAKLVNELAETADDKQLTKTINRYGRVDLIYVDLPRDLLLGGAQRRYPRARAQAGSACATYLRKWSSAVAL